MTKNCCHNRSRETLKTTSKTFSHRQHYELRTETWREQNGKANMAPPPPKVETQHWDNNRHNTTHNTHTHTTQHTTQTHTHKTQLICTTTQPTWQQHTPSTSQCQIDIIVINQSKYGFRYRKQPFVESKPARQCCLLQIVNKTCHAKLNIISPKLQRSWKWHVPMSDRT